jgi:DNA-binding transcriptional LysR family regulator
VQIVPQHMDDEQAHERLQDREIDFAIGMIVGQRVDWRRVNLFNDRMVVIARRGHPLARKKASLAALAAQRHVQIPVLGWLDILLSSRGLKRNYAVTSSNILAVPFIVARSDLIAIVPNSVAIRFKEFCGLDEVATSVALPAFVVDLVSHARNDLDPAHRWLVDCIRAIAEDMRRDPRNFPSAVQ